MVLYFAIKSRELLHAPSAGGKNVRLQIHSLGQCQGLQRFPHLNSSWDWRLVRKTVGISDLSICKLHIFPCGWFFFVFGWFDQTLFLHVPSQLGFWIHDCSCWSCWLWLFKAFLVLSSNFRNHCKHVVWHLYSHHALFSGYDNQIDAWDVWCLSPDNQIKPKCTLLVFLLFCWQSQLQAIGSIVGLLLFCYNSKQERRPCSSLTHRF